MARAHLRHTVKDRAGNAIQNALVYAYLQGTVTPVSDMYAGASGGSAITTLTSNNQGEVQAWFTGPKFVDLKVTDNTDTAYYPSDPSSLKSFSEFTETVEVVPPPEEVSPARPVTWDGADTTGASDSRSAINTAQTNHDSIAFPAGTYLINSNITLTKRMSFARGATLKPASGVVITIEGQVEAGYHQIFDLSASGTFYFTKQKVGNVVKFAWFGNDPTGAVSSASALQACVNSVLGSAAAASNTRTAAAPIDLGMGTFLLDADIAITSVLGFHMFGWGPHITDFKPSGTRTRLFDINGFSRSCIEGFSVNGNGTEDITEVVAIYHDIAGSSRTTNYSVAKNITIGATTRWRTGFHIGKTGQNTQCDTITLRDIVVGGAWASGETTYCPRSTVAT